MPRKAREKSTTGIYHVMLRDINQQQIFEEREDYIKLLEIIKEYKAISDFEVYAYCLMGNHIHLLIKVKKEPLEQIFKRIGGKFVYWYNVKYQRVGHLFQDRFKSEPVETMDYLMTVIRYIHQNPVKAGICKEIEDYPYSSFKEYIDRAQIVDVEFILNMRDLERFVKFNKIKNDDKCLDIVDKAKIRVTDEQAKLIIKKISKCDSVAEFQALDLKNRDKLIGKFKDKGVSIRQISRLTGVSKGIIEKI